MATTADRLFAYTVQDLLRYSERIDRELDLTDRIQCALCQDRGYVSTHAEAYGQPVVFTDPCPQCTG